MNIKRAKEEIKHTIKAYLQKDENGRYLIPEIRQRPVLLMGPPGVGKTQIMEQIAGEMDLALVAYTITHHTRQSAIGLPFIREKTYGGEVRSVTEYTMSEIIASMYDRMERSGKKEGILFIDEINCVSETLAPTMLQFLQGKTFGNQKVPAGWIIVAAGNPPEYNRSVRTFDVVTLDRIRMIPVEADYEIWKEYAQQAGVHGSILSYLNLRRDHFYRIEMTVDGRQFVTARGWEDLSEIIFASERLGYTVDREVAGQYLQHPAVAKDFANYLELFYKYRTDYQVEEILSGVIRPGTLNKLKFAPFDERVKVVSLLLSSLSETFRSVCETEDLTQVLHGYLVRIRDEMNAGDAGAEENNRTQTASWEAGAEENSRTRTGSGQTQAGRGDFLARFIKQGRAVLEQRVAAGQNERMLERREGKALDLLESWGRHSGTGSTAMPDAENGNGQPGEAAKEDGFTFLREAFSRHIEALEASAEAASAELEHAFDFMEAAFGESQEMVIFITELSLNPSAAHFLSQHPCDRYYMYNKNLLFSDREAQVRAQLDEIRDLQIT